MGIAVSITIIIIGIIYLAISGELGNSAADRKIQEMRRSEDRIDPRPRTAAGNKVISNGFTYRRNFK